MAGPQTGCRVSIDMQELVLHTPPHEIIMLVMWLTGGAVDPQIVAGNIEHIKREAHVGSNLVQLYGGVGGGELGRDGMVLYRQALDEVSK